jgi:pectate lyase
VALAVVAATATCGEVKLYPYASETGAKVDCVGDVVGFAAVASSDADGGVSEATTGGGDATPVPVNDVAGLTEALHRTEPTVILLDGMLPLTEAIKVTVDKDMRNGNKTLIGVGANSGLTGAGLDLSYADNVIVRNLKISKAHFGEGDAITILASHHIWIDHCDLSSDRNDTTAGYDGLVDITHGSAFITVSWTLFHDHKDTSLVGHTADPTAQAEDQNLKVTFHHNLFLNVNSGPRVRWGVAHVFSNHFQDVEAFGVVSVSSAAVKVEYNLFDNVPLPIATGYSGEASGSMNEGGNKFPAGFVPDIVQAAPEIVVPYTYPRDSATSSSAVIEKCAGTGILKLP